jgi:hypothetical protein
MLIQLTDLEVLQQADKEAWDLVIALKAASMQASEVAMATSAALVLYHRDLPKAKSHLSSDSELEGDTVDYGL